MFAAQQVGSIAGPILGGSVATYLGMHYVFYTAGFFLLSMAAFLRLSVYLIYLLIFVGFLSPNYRLEPILITHILLDFFLFL